MKELSNFLVGVVDGRPRYDWTEALDGRVWWVRPDAMPLGLERFRTQLSNKARVQTGGLRTKRALGGVLIFQATDGRHTGGLPVSEWVDRATGQEETVSVLLPVVLVRRIDALGRSRSDTLRRCLDAHLEVLEAPPIQST